MTHAVVVLMALAMSSYSAFDRKFPISVGAGPGNVRAAAANEGAAIGDVSLGRDSTIIKPVSVPTAGLPNRKPIAYRVVQGDSLESISLAYRVAQGDSLERTALAFNIPMRHITCSNPGLRLPLTAAQSLRLPPIP